MSRRVSHLAEIERRHRQSAEIYQENERFYEDREIYALAEALKKSSYSKKEEAKSLFEEGLNQQFNILNNEAKSYVDSLFTKLKSAHFRDIDLAIETFAELIEKDKKSGTNVAVEAAFKLFRN